MSREIARGERLTMAFGVDRSPMIGAFVQVWDHTKGSGNEPCFNPEEVEYFNGVERHDCSTTGGRNLTEEFILGVARKHGIPLEEMTVYRVLD